MGSGWIPMRTDLASDARVVTIALRTSVTVTQVCGALFAVWCQADAHGEGETDAFLPVPTDALDAIAHIKGFAAAMAEVGWLELTDRGVIFPKYVTYNGTTAKKRKQAQHRMEAFRARKTQSVTHERNVCVTTLQNNTDIPPTPLTGGSPPKRKAPKFTRPAPEEALLYGQSIGLDEDDCHRFCDYFDANGWVVGKGRAPMKDWRAAMRNWKRMSREFRPAKATDAEIEQAIAGGLADAAERKRR